MKKLIVVAVVSVLMSLSWTSVSFATETTQAASTVTAPAGETSNGMSADKPVAAEDKDASSAGLGDTLKTYWNKFIDVFTGPATK